MMSATGQKPTLQGDRRMSAVPPEADEVDGSAHGIGCARDAMSWQTGQTGNRDNPSDVQGIKA
jgi:hypothetical protein